MAVLPIPTDQYDKTAEQRRNQVIETALDKTLTRFVDIEVAVNRIILTSPDGTRYRLIVQDGGALATVAI